MSRPNEKSKIIEHYDVVSPYYQSFWGEHLHHGYWIHGDESREAAQVQLIEHLARRANVRPGSEVLDIGCGFGASSLYLARNYGANATGINISPIQVEMANRAARKANLDVKFLLMDAESMRFSQSFDLLWSVESISHYHDPQKFFASAVKFLKPGALVNIPCHLVDYVVTENGIAGPLEGMSVAERADALIKIAHKDFQDELVKDAKERGIFQ